MVKKGVRGIRRISEGEPVRVPADVLEGLEAVRRHTGTDVLDVATVRYFAFASVRAVASNGHRRCLPRAREKVNSEK